MSALLLLVLTGASFSISFGVIRLLRAVRMLRLRRLDAQYRAAALVAQSRMAHRAGQHRVQEREWGRAA